MIQQLDEGVGGIDRIALVHYGSFSRSLPLPVGATEADVKIPIQRT